jgi:hypothetical protein
MNFTTKISIAKSTNPIDYDSKIISLGSCFAENIGKKFQYFKFQITTNPFGIIFNPFSIKNLIDRIVNKQQFSENDIFFLNDSWHCFEVHSELSHPNKEEFLRNLNALIESTHTQLTKSTHVIITYGTSWIYRNKSTKSIVANCYKVSQNQFEKELLSTQIIEESIRNTIETIQKVNPNCHFILTISPVRHIKEGFVENQRSKAHLISAIHNLQHASHNSNYFPSYEIMMDELRDYRFYAEDMLHPSQVAIDYIWKRFMASQMEEAIYPIMEEVTTIQKGLAHRSFNPSTSNHQQFLNKLNEKISKLKGLFPNMEF